MTSDFNFCWYIILSISLRVRFFFLMNDKSDNHIFIYLEQYI
uniref:Uncharacterized protein n=1 Tax=Anguilla anguilla TaxID=7936 RepID=A0A0E9UUS1_ANGAN